MVAIQASPIEDDPWRGPPQRQCPPKRAQRREHVFDVARQGPPRPALASSSAGGMSAAGLAVSAAARAQVRGSGPFRPHLHCVARAMGGCGGVGGRRLTGPELPRSGPAMTRAAGRSTDNRRHTAPGHASAFRAGPPAGGGYRQVTGPGHRCVLSRASGSTPAPVRSAHDATPLSCAAGVSVGAAVCPVRTARLATPAGTGSRAGGHPVAAPPSEPAWPPATPAPLGRPRLGCCDASGRSRCS
jgi:hypothetical protein